MAKAQKNQEFSNTFRKTWKFPLPAWMSKDEDPIGFNRGLYITFSLGFKLKD